MKTLREAAADLSTERLARAYEGLIFSIGACGKLKKDDCRVVADYYIKHNLVKFDFVNSRYDVRHGGYYMPDVLRRAVDAAKKEGAGK